MNKFLSATMSVVGVVVLVGGLAAGVLLVKSPQIFREKAAGTVALYIDPVSQTKRRGNTFTFNVVMDTNVKSITGFDIKMSFDPSAIQVDSLAKGSGVNAFTSPLYTDKIDNTVGSIAYGYYTLAAGAVKGSAVEVLKVNARLKATAQTGTYNFTFLPTSLLASIEDVTNALQTTSPGHITVNKIGDVNSDTFVNLLDINDIIKDYGNSPPTNPGTDLDESGTVNLLDINIVIKNYGT